MLISAWDVQYLRHTIYMYQTNKQAEKRNFGGIAIGMPASPPLEPILYVIVKIIQLHLEILGAFFWDNRERVNDLRSLRLCCIKGTGESLGRVDLPPPMIDDDPNDLGSLILFHIQGCS